MYELLNKMRGTLLRKESCERGSASIEAAIVLPIFLCIVVAVYTLINFCIVQGKIAYAIDTTAKEMSQYSYIYHKLGGDTLSASMSEKSSLIVDTYENFSNMINSSKTAVSTGGTNLSELVKDGKVVAGDLSKIVDNPGEYVSSLASLVGSKASNAVKSAIASALAEGLTRRHFGDSDQEADAYLAGKGVTDGYAGLDFSRSMMFKDASGDILIVVSYELDLASVVPFVDKKVTIVQSAVTKGWLGGDKGVTNGGGSDGDGGDGSGDGSGDGGSGGGSGDGGSGDGGSGGGGSE